jgi:hypothetical protein
MLKRIQHDKPNVTLNLFQGLNTDSETSSE